MEINSSYMEENIPMLLNQKLHFKNNGHMLMLLLICNCINCIVVVFFRHLGLPQLGCEMKHTDYIILKIENVNADCCSINKI